MNKYTPVLIAAGAAAAFWWWKRKEWEKSQPRQITEQDMIDIFAPEGDPTSSANMWTAGQYTVA